MKLKNILFLLLIIACVMAVAGCSSDNDGSDVQQVKTPAEPQASNPAQPTPTIIPTPTPIVTPTPINQDSEWIGSFQKYAPLLGLDARTISLDNGRNGHSSNLASDAYALLNDTQEALKENNQYTISSKYYDAQNEWVQALNDFNSAGTSMLIMTERITYSDRNEEADALEKAFRNFPTQIVSGTNHLNRAITLFNAETGSSIELQ